MTEGLAKMAKHTARSEWENIQGFDNSSREYVRLDGDAWLAAHHIREEGNRRGKRNQPGADETLPDEMYRKIENWVAKRALDCKEAVSKYISEELANLHDLGSSWQKESPEITLEALVNQRCQNLETLSAQSVSDLDKQRAEYEEAFRDLGSFRQRHRLSRVADYPNNQIAHWLWVPVAGIVESFAGANLLGSVSRGGVIEGWMVALVLTVVNVLLGIGAGRMWRFTNYDRGFKKLFASVLGVLCAMAALVWNDVAGHVRDVYVLAENTGALETTDEAFASAYRTMIERPLPWESLPSAGLALVGIAVFVLTAFKSYTADDRFPGYGPRHRKVDSLHGRYQDGLNDALDELKAARDDANARIEEIKDRYEMDRAGWNSSLDRLRMVVDEYPANLRQYNKDLGYLLAAYRTANLATRKARPPPFFDTEPTIDESVLQPTEFSIPDAPDWGDIPNKAEAGIARVEKTYEELRTRYQMLDHVVDDYTEDDA